MKNIFLVSFLFLLFSCKSSKEQLKTISVFEIVKKSNNNKVDLSNMNLETIPDLSKLELQEINLSNNKIKDFDEKLFPMTLKVLNLSNNRINNSVSIKNLELNKLNLSNNCIVKFYIDKSIINNLNLSFNKLELIQMPLYSSKEILADTLNISNNKKLDNYVSFMPSVYKFINKNNIKNSKPLQFVLEKPIE